MNKITTTIAIVIGSLFITAILVLVIGFWPGSTKEVESIANQFQPNPEWQLASEAINPPRAICLQADCNSVTRSWKLEENITTEEFIAVLERSGWGDMVTDDVECSTREDITSTAGQVVCSTEELRDKFYVSLYANGDHADPSRASLILRVQKRG